MSPELTEFYRNGEIDDAERRLFWTSIFGKTIGFVCCDTITVAVDSNHPKSSLQWVFWKQRTPISQELFTKIKES